VEDVGTLEKREACWRLGILPMEFIGRRVLFCVCIVVWRSEIDGSGRRIGGKSWGGHDGLQEQSPGCPDILFPEASYSTLSLSNSIRALDVSFSCWKHCQAVVEVLTTRVIYSHLCSDMVDRGTLSWPPCG
jgi:hypothetical protein